jgi:hypothetical protein
MYSTILAVYRNASLEHWPAFNMIHMCACARLCNWGCITFCVSHLKARKFYTTLTLFNDVQKLNILNF